MPATNIVIIGAGSASFGPTTLATLIREPRLRGSRLALVDLDEENLTSIVRVAERMSAAWDADMRISASTNRCDVLAGAEFVIVSIEVPPREELWRLDWEIPVKHGLRQPYGENGGPGGLMHTCRQVPPFMDIVRDMEQLCPDAWLINFSNPLPRITRAITKYSRIRTVGKCHQIEVGYGITAVLLRQRYGIRVPDGVNLHSDPGNVGTIRALANAGRQHVKIKSAGLNHFIWLLDVRDRETGEDLYPALRAALADAPPTLEPFSMALFRAFDLCPIPGDTHLVEYLHLAHDPLAKPWETYRIPLYDWGGNEAARRFLRNMMAQMAGGKLPVDGMKEAPSEGAAELIAAIAGNENYYDEAVNIPNGRAIPNLPPETIVEVPALVSGMGIHGLPVGELPPAVAALLRREADLVELVVDTAVTGDRHLALQALLLDPMINDIGRAQAVLDDYLRAFAHTLPQFA
ncbi:MAG: alpha-glucosidase/alpha-galactosidase [Anaerolineales bacterium]|nr:alpha-glucosidase/alpha-galactosidase [Anaerolineales bacterium]